MREVLAPLDPPQASTTYALEQIESLYPRLSEPLYRSYPALKLGRSREVEFFSRRLVVLAEKILREHLATGAEKRRWVMTAPPYHQLPAAANLLARRSQELLRQRGYEIALHEMRLSAQQVAVADQAELRESLEYSKSTYEQRVKHRSKLQRIDNSPELATQIADANVLIVNDINVTGAQQVSLSRMLMQLQAHSCHWLYIFNVEKSIADQNPQIENVINSSQHSDVDDYATVLCSDGILYTARCLSLLFSYDMDSFRYLVSRLPPEARQQLHRAALSERRYGSCAFAERMTMLAGK